MKLQKAVDEYLACQTHLTDGSLSIYNRELNSLINYYEGEIEDLERKDIAQFTKSLQKTKNEGGVAHTMRIVKSFVKHAHDMGWTDLNTSAVRIPRSVAPVKEILEDYEFNAMLDECNSTRDKLILAILWDTGIRVSELCDIKVNDLFNGGVNIVRRKSYRRNAVYFDELSSYYLTKWLSEMPCCEYVFVSRSCNQLSSRDIQRLIKKVSHMLDKDVTPHTFRHTLAWRILDAGGELIDIQNALGHTDPLTTQRNYMNWIDDRRRSRVQKLINSGYNNRNAVSQKRKTESGVDRSVPYVGQVC